MRCGETPSLETPKTSWDAACVCRSLLRRAVFCSKDHSYTQLLRDFCGTWATALLGSHESLQLDVCLFQPQIALADGSLFTSFVLALHITTFDIRTSSPTAGTFSTSGLIAAAFLQHLTCTLDWSFLFFPKNLGKKKTQRLSLCSGTR